MALLDHYVIERATDSGFTAGVTDFTIGNVVDYEDTTGTIGVTYYYRIKAVDVDGVSSAWTTPGQAGVKTGAVITPLIGAHAAAASGPAAATTSAIDTTGCSLLVVVASSFNSSGSGVITITDSKSNTWVGLTAHEVTNGDRVQMFYVKNPTVGTGHTFTATPAVTGYCSLCVEGFNHTDTTANADQQNGASNSSSATLATGSITPTTDQQLIVAAVAGDTATASIDAGFTVAQSQAYTAGLNVQCALAYKVQTAAAAVNPTWTIGSATNIAAAIASFKSV